MCEISGSKNYGIYLNGKAGALIENSKIKGNLWDGVMVMGESDVRYYIPILKK
jgi:hypothetical protein